MIYNAYVQNKTKLDTQGNESKFVGYNKSSPVNLINFPKKIHPLKNYIVYNLLRHSEIMVTKLTICHLCLKKLRCYDLNSFQLILQQKWVITQKLTKMLRVQIYIILPKKKNRHFFVENFRDYTAQCFYSMRTTPKSYREAINSVDSENWSVVMQQETKTLIETNAYELVSVLPFNMTHFSISSNQILNHT